MSRLDEFRAALRGMDGCVLALSSPTVLSVIAELRHAADVSDQRLRSLQRPGKQAAGGRPTLAPVASKGKYAALVSMCGIATFGLELQPFAFSTANLARLISQLAADPTIETIVLDIDTPGGMVTGTQEAADAVYAAARKKPVIGLVNPLCASAGYWIASQCTEIVGVPSADIGSIGVFMCHYDLSSMLADAGIKPTFIFAGQHKVEGNSAEPLGGDAKRWFQSQVDATYRDFVGAVARGRKTSTSTVKAKFGGGRCYSARDALAAGMIDSISASADTAIQQVLSGAPFGRSIASASAGYRALVDEAKRTNPLPGDVFRAKLAVLVAG